jgi:NAD(P) transhydrogenase subunit alpha
MSGSKLRGILCQRINRLPLAPTLKLSLKRKSESDPPMEHVDPTVFRLAIFVLAIFVGYYVVWSVTPALHTPLMAVTNAISSVIIVGGLLAAAALSGDATGVNGWIAKGAGVAAVTLASVNIFGGFMVTRRMLAMYKKKDRPKAASGAG